MLHVSEKCYCGYMRARDNQRIFGAGFALETFSFSLPLSVPSSSPVYVCVCIYVNVLFLSGVCPSVRPSVVRLSPVRNLFLSLRGFSEVLADDNVFFFFFFSLRNPARQCTPRITYRDMYIYVRTYV